MMNDDDTLDEFDLSAWEAPPPPADLADAVIDRMGGTQTDVAVAIPVEERGPRRAWIIAGAAVGAIVLALGVWSLVRATRPAAPTSGAVVAERAQSLSLDTVNADLDPGADVRWKRRGDVLYIEQRAGRVVWRVADDEKIVIDAGAASASVEATGANLRVEVQMNATDAKVIGATALTAAAVSIVTVVVYEGYVRVGKPNQQTVVVAPGTTYKVNADQEEAPVVGSAPVDVKMSTKVAILGLELVVGPNGSVGGDEPVVAQVLSAEMRAAADSIGSYKLAPSGDKDLVDLKLLNNCTSEAPQCMSAIGAELAADKLVYGKIERIKVGYHVSLKLLDVARKQVERTISWGIPQAEAEGEGLTTWGKRMYGAIVGEASTTCDAEVLKEEGMQNINMGQHAVALLKFEASLRCKQNSHTQQLAFMASCASGNSPKAKYYYRLLPAAQQQRFSQMCIRSNTAYEGDEDTIKPESLDRAMISGGIAAVKSNVSACGDKAGGGGKVKVTIKVGPDGDVTSAQAEQTPSKALGDCVVAAVKRAQFGETMNGGSFSYPFVFPAVKKQEPEPAAPANCDPNALKEKGMQNINLGQHAAALVMFEASLRCKQNSHTVQLAFMAACASGNAPKAKVYYKKLASHLQDRFRQMCVRNNTDYE